MGAGGLKRPGAGMPSPRQGGSPFLQNAIQNSQMSKQMPQQNPMQQNPMQQMPMGQQGGFSQIGKQMPQQNPMQQGGPMQQLQGMGGMLGGMGGPMQQNPMMQQGFDPRAIAANPQGFMDYMSGMKAQEASHPGSTMLSGPMQQGAAGGKGGMPGAGPAPNAMQQFSQQQGLAGLMQPQQSSLNSLQ